MGYSCAQAMDWGPWLATISLAVDFIGTAEIRQWLAVESEVIKAGGTICFAHGLARLPITMAYVSRRPPKMPDGRISRVRFQILAYPLWAFP